VLNEVYPEQIISKIGWNNEVYPEQIISKIGWNNTKSLFVQCRSVKCSTSGCKEL